MKLKVQVNKRFFKDAYDSVGHCFPVTESELSLWNGVGKYKT